MKKTDLISLANTPNNKIKVCKIIKQEDNLIQFIVSRNISKPKDMLEQLTGYEVIENIISKKQIPPTLFNIINSSFENDHLFYNRADVMYNSFIMSYATHRPLVLSPDMIWLLISQSIARHINNNPDLFRHTLVAFEGKKVLTIKSPKDLFAKDVDWTAILQKFWKQIDDNTNGDYATNMRCNFSTTGPTEDIASVTTLMGSVKSYFEYIVHHMICGIPNITLLGKVEDWELVLQKAQILKQLSLEYWYEWIEPILHEFIRAAKGFPNLEFWQSIVIRNNSKNIDLGGGCIPSSSMIDGWCVALFPFSKEEDDDELQHEDLETSSVNWQKDSEIMRVEFKYIKEYPNKKCEEIPMELWAGFIGIKEDESTHSLTPQIGWFIRKSNAEQESLSRLIGQNEYQGIYITIKPGETVPPILQKLEYISRLNLTFCGPVELPTWMDEMDIKELIVYGRLDSKNETILKKRFERCNFKCYKFEFNND